MAKKFTQVYKVAKETAYARPTAALILSASLNPVYDFVPVQKPNGVVDNGSTTAEYNIQRVKRIKGTSVANANANTTTAALAALDTFSSVDWETIGVATGHLKSVGIKMGINEEFDADNIGETHAKAIATSVEGQVVVRHEELLSEILTYSSSAQNFADGGTFTDATASDTTPVSDLIREKITEVQVKVDDFKHMTDTSNMLVLAHPLVSNRMGKEIGKEYKNEMPIYKTGIQSVFQIEGVPVIKDANLNKYEGYKAGFTASEPLNTIGAIVMDIEAVAFKAKEFAKPIYQDLGLVKFFGQFFYNIQKVVDPSRIVVIQYVLPTGFTKSKTAYEA